MLLLFTVLPESMRRVRHDLMVRFGDQRLMRFNQVIHKPKAVLRRHFALAALAVCLFSTVASDAFGQIDLASFITPIVSPLDDDAIVVRVAEESDGNVMSVAGADTTAAKRSRSPDEIARLAARKASLALLMRGDLRADQAGVFRSSKKQQATLELRSKVQEFRIARQTQLVASQALELHFGLATLAALDPIQREVDAILSVHQERQVQAIASGISILDPTALERLQATAKDTQLQTQSKAFQLRSQLALLVDPSIACHYLPEPMCVPNPMLADNCQMIEWAISQRCDLAGLVYLRTHLTEETLDVARWMSDILSGSATITAGIIPRPLSLLGIVLPNEKKAMHDELCARLSMLDEAIKSLREKIASEVDIAINKQSTAASRYTNAQSHVEMWQTRLAQLRAYGDQVKAQTADELEAEMQLRQSQNELVQRQGDWHQAIVELGVAIGCVP